MWNELGGILNDEGRGVGL